MKRIFVFTLLILFVFMSCKQNSSTDNKNIDADSIALSDNIKPDTIIEGSELFFGERVVYSYDDKSNIIKEETFDKYGDTNKSIDRVYDDRNNIIMESFKEYGSPEYVILYKYDAKNHKVEEREESLETYTRFNYDDNGNLIESAIVKSNSGEVVSHTINKYERNKLIETTEQNIFKTIYIYNGDNLIEEISYSDTTNIETTRIAYEYDSKRNKTKMSHYLYNKLYNTIKYTYDDNNNLIEEIYQEVDSQVKFVTKYNYNSNNKLLEESVYKQGILDKRKFYTYDDKNRLISTIYYADDIMLYNDDCIVE